MNIPRVSALLLLLSLAGALPASAQFAPDHGAGRFDGIERWRFGIGVSNRGDTVFRYAVNWDSRRKWDRRPGDEVTLRPTFKGYDHTMLRFTDSTIIPLRVGRTPLIISYIPYSDTVALVVERVGRNLVVDFDRITLESVRNPSVYRVNTWDTVRGSIREAALEKIVIGMPFDEANRLMRASYTRTSSDFPGTTIYPIDLQRSIYIEAKEKLVSRVWIGPRRN